MALCKNGQSASHVYFSPDGVNVLAPLFVAVGDRVVWDGRIPAYVNVPRGQAVAAGGNNTVSGDAVLSVPAGDASADGGTHDVSADVNMVTPAGGGSADGFGFDDLVADAAFDVPSGSGSADGGGDTLVDAFNGVFAPSGKVSADGGVHAVRAEFAADVPSGGVSADGGLTMAQADGASDIPAGDGSADGGTTGIAADASLTVPAGSVAAQGSVPALSFDANVIVPGGSGTASGGTPQVAGMNLSRQRMVKSGDSTAASDSASIVPNWTPDTVFPAAISNNTLVVAGAGPVTITFHADYYNGAVSGTATLYLYKNGVSIGTLGVPGGSAAINLTWTGVVANGDQIAAYFQPWVSAFYSLTIKGTTSYIDVNPS